MFWRIPKVNIEMIRITPHIKPKDNIKQGFSISRRQITNSQYAMFASSNPEHQRPELSWDQQLLDLKTRLPYGEMPVTGVKKNDALAFMDWLKTTTSIKTFLPTEEQWVKAVMPHENWTETAEISENYRCTNPYGLMFYFDSIRFDWTSSLSKGCNNYGRLRGLEIKKTDMGAFSKLNRINLEHNIATLQLAFNDAKDLITTNTFEVDAPYDKGDFSSFRIITLDILSPEDEI